MKGHPTGADPLRRTAEAEPEHRRPGHPPPVPVRDRHSDRGRGRETPDEAAAATAWKAGRDGCVLAVQADAGSRVALRVLGPRAEACREPIAVSSRSPDPQVRLIGNFAATPFELDGVRYGSAE